MQKPKNAAALSASYHVFGGISGWTLCTEALRHFIDTKIDVSMVLLVFLGSFGKTAMAAFCTFEFAGISVTRSHGPSFVSGQVAIGKQQFNT
ncbi:hypothetical protein [Agrobacterium rosae]|uniref:hypothetical protein n=1 Tax=Agrobacterium rosae TaxID=1972867 RepID=UPI0015F2C292|nr:hypothetical protein [Agrobacterium rosae]